MLGTSTSNDSHQRDGAGRGDFKTDPTAGSERGHGFLMVM